MLYSIKDWVKFVKETTEKKPQVDHAIIESQPDKGKCPICLEEFIISLGLKFGSCQHVTCPDPTCQDGIREHCNVCPLCHAPIIKEIAVIEPWGPDPTPPPMQPMPNPGAEPWNIPSEGDDPFNHINCYLKNHPCASSIFLQPIGPIGGW